MTPRYFSTVVASVSTAQTHSTRSFQAEYVTELPARVVTEELPPLHEADVESVADTDGALYGGRPGENRYKGKSCFMKCIASCRGLCWGEAYWVWNLLCCPAVMIWRPVMSYFVPCVQVYFESFLLLLFCKCKSWIMYNDRGFQGDAASGEAKTNWVRGGTMIKSHIGEGKRPVLFPRKPSPDDVAQGSLGDCWLISAFACMAESEEAIRNIFVTKRFSERGRYCVKLYDGRKDSWVNIQVDDKIPCRPNSDSPIFAKAKKGAVWVMILEKAFAKFCNGYKNLSGGHMTWAFQAMTGDVVFTLAKSGENWSRYDLKYTEKSHNVVMDFFSSVCQAIFFCFWCKHPENPREQYTHAWSKDKFKQDQVWGILHKYSKRGALIGCSAAAKKEEKKEDGVVRGHAYTLLAAKKVGKYRMMQMRNPWGKFEWKGDWSDESKMWEQHPNVAQAVGFDRKNDAKNDGVFWMEFQDFLKIYDHIDVCDRSTNRDIALDIEEERGLWGVCCGCLESCFKFLACCQGCITLYLGNRTSQEVETEDNFCSCL